MSLFLHHLVSSSCFLTDTKSAIPFHTKIAKLLQFFGNVIPVELTNERTTHTQQKPRAFDPTNPPTHKKIIPFFNHWTQQIPTQDFISVNFSSQFGFLGLFMKNSFRFFHQWRFLSFSLSSTKGFLWPNPLLCYLDFRLSCHHLLPFLSLLQLNHWLFKSFVIFVVASYFEFTRDYLSSSLCLSFTSFFRTLVVLLFSSCLFYFSSPSLFWYSSILLSLVFLLRFVCFLFDHPQLALSHLLLLRRLFPMFVGQLDRNPNRRNGWCRVLGSEFTVMGMFTRGNFTKGGAQVVGFITIIWVEGMKAIGLMRSMMGME